MIKESDIHFHNPTPIPYDWGETAYFNFYIPEANIIGLVYVVHRAGIGATVADIQIVDRWSTRFDETAYVDQSHHNPIPDNAVSFSLPNGLTFRAESLKNYSLSYRSADMDLDLDCEGVMEPFDIHDPEMDPMASPETQGDTETTGFGSAYAAHFDMTARLKGELRLGSRRYKVDCIATMDHSWGPRPEAGLSSVAWLNAHFDKDNFFHGIFSYDPYASKGEQHIFRHGYISVDGEIRGLIAGNVATDRDGFYPKAAEINITDLKNTRYNLKGVATNHHPWLPYGNCLSPISMMHWKLNDSSQGVGTYLEGFPLNNRLRRS